MRKDLELIYNESKIAPKAGDYVWVRHTKYYSWDYAIFIEATKKGFKAYNHCIERAEYIDCYAELVTKDPWYSEVFIHSK